MKKEAKTFVNKRASRPRLDARVAKVFGSFFKKNRLLYPAPDQATGYYKRSHSEVFMVIKGWLLAAIAVGSLSWTIMPADAQDATAGQTAFQSQCSICHSVQPGKKMIGPSLFGVVGRKAGQDPTFHYSPANKASGLTWDAATLDRYLTSPRDVVPHTIMTYNGLKDGPKRASLIAYLTTLH